MWSFIGFLVVVAITYFVYSAVSKNLDQQQKQLYAELLILDAEWHQLEAEKQRIKEK